MPRIESDVKLDFKDVLIRPKRSTLKSRSDVTLDITYTFKHSKQKWTGVPIMAANMDTVGTFEMAVAFSETNMITCIHKHYSLEQWSQFDEEHPDALRNVAVSCGTSDSDFEKLQDVMAKVNVPFVCIDVANGYSEYFVAHVRRTRETFPDKIIIAGNVVTGEMTEELILSGADIVKVGIGPGSVCTTRKKTGVGYPQLSAVLECADAAHGLGGHVISDGGCTCPGDFSKAFGAGTDFVMAGGMFAAHDESGGELVVDDNGQRFKAFYGMSSAVAMNKHSGGVANYRAAEGKAVRLPYRGPVSETVGDILGGLRSSCTYVGASKLKELSKRTTFIRVTQQLNEVFGSRDESSTFSVGNKRPLSNGCDTDEAHATKKTA